MPDRKPPGHGDPERPPPQPTDWPGPSIDRPAREVVVDRPATDWDGPLQPPIDRPEPPGPGTDGPGPEA
jgi:hypothetical protein